MVLPTITSIDIRKFRKRRQYRATITGENFPPTIYPGFVLEVINAGSSTKYPIDPDIYTFNGPTKIVLTGKIPQAAPVGRYHICLENGIGLPSFIYNAFRLTK